MSNENLSDRYNPAEVEARTYAWWESKSYFKAEDQSTKPPFSIILPPPNVTGFLHLGHALDHSIQDCLIRWKRMSGFNTLWLPGSDHAGIATQSVVEKELKKEGTSRHELGREKFIERVWEFKHQFGDRIYKQMRRLGDSCDWDRAVFTLDPGVSQSVRKVFVSLYKKGWIYRGTRLVNWSGPLETAISDLEVEHRTVKSSIWHIRYPIEGTTETLTVATTRPETILGDTALCVNPDDERYSQLIGKTAIVPLMNRRIPIISDTYVDPAFGTGVVKITPAHDFNDYKIGKAHNLPFINILTRKATMNENTGPYQGLSVQEARKRILDDLKNLNLFEKEEPHTLNVGHCSRSGAVVEPFLSEQWFVKTEHLAIPAQRTVESGTVAFEPENWTKVYLHWMSIIEDWCISRQLWWGHRIPAWVCENCSHTTVAEEDPTSCEKCGTAAPKQDEDVLDTWFSSALWPFSTLGWPNETEALKTFYPTNVLVTGHDILFFWVARMMMMGLEFRRDVPFRQVYLHGLVRDSQGRKMSKSLGNSIDPIDMIDKYGADALRYSFLAHMHSGKDFKFSEQRTEGYRNFMNKIWNGTRFALGQLQDFKVPAAEGGDTQKILPPKEGLSAYDQWILSKLGHVMTTVDEALENHRFSEAAGALYSFVWHDFCDWYIEFCKPIFASGTPAEKQATQTVMALVLNRVVRLLHPFAPFITEELYQKLPIHNEACIIDQYPTPLHDRELLAFGSDVAAREVELIKDVISAVRNIRGENRISPAIKLDIRMSPSDEFAKSVLENHRASLISMGRIENLTIGAEGSLSKCAVTLCQAGQSTVKVIIPLEGLVDIEEEIKRIEKTIEKLNKDITLLSGRLNNENFVKNASEDVVETDRKLLEDSKTQVVSMREALLRLQS